MTIPSVIQGLIKTEDGKVFELDSPKGSAWLESRGSFRFEPSSGSKPYTVRKESGIYWYGCRKIAGKVRKKYIGKSSKVTVAKLEEIAEALEIPPVPRANKVAEVAERVRERVTERVTEVAQDRLTALELQVANLHKAVEALQEALSGKLEAGDSLELPKVDSGVAEQLQNELGNPQLSEGEYEPFRLDEDLKRLLAQKHPLVPGHLWQEFERLKERNRQLRLKIGEERRSSIETISELEQRIENMMRRNQQKQARIDELEVELLNPNTEVAEQLQNELGNLKAENEKLRQRLAESQDTIEKLNWGTEALNEQLAVANQAILERDDSIESLRQELTENTRYYAGRLNEAGATIGTFKDKLAAAQAKNQRLQNDLGNLQAQVAELREQLKIERASREENKKSAPVGRDLPDAADLLNKLKAKRKKSKTDLADLEAILELLQG